MELSVSAHSTLNPAAPWWYPTGHEAIIIPDDCIVVNAQALNRFNQVLEPTPHAALAHAVKLLRTGINGYMVLTGKDLRNVYADWARSFPRPFDLSLSLMKAATIRQHLYKAICYNSMNTRESEQVMKPRHIVIAMRIVSCLNNLVKRILLAERSGNFVSQFFDTKYRGQHNKRHHATSRVYSVPGRLDEHVDWLRDSPLSLQSLASGPLLHLEIVVKIASFEEKMEEKEQINAYPTRDSHTAA
ncbi:uncharacterized protein F4812DRAFT_463721 [Daldinia caldariorum]|uniref:uncharacterized protein n=1 Tax=Daldinia caldariorum TaxID=326644 RepID=UPI002007FD3A|nr:uncharacterized protein F4812DRAFT_463721 [Daldinia caldariorum]KAI1463385.1 hypothetical protein F4812DRAFT_463721 [Daldinia caldariorum]